MSGSGDAYIDLQYLYLNAKLCLPEMASQWFDIVKVYVGVALLVRLLAGSGLFPSFILHLVSMGMGVWLLWFYHEGVVWYFIALSLMAYLIYTFQPLPKGPLMGALAVVFISICEFVLVDAVKWHEIRGSMLLLIMKLVSLGFDLDNLREQKNADKRWQSVDSVGKDQGELLEKSNVHSKEKENLRKRTPSGEGKQQKNPVGQDLEKDGRSLPRSARPDAPIASLTYGLVGTRLADNPPSILDVMSYALSPLTTVFGPFLTYRDHERFLKPAPMSVSWLWHTARCMVLSFVWLCVSVCVSSDIFLAPTWSKWMVAYGSALSFRSSHYFISFLSEGIATAGGLGFSQEQGHWGGLKVVGPLDVEIPRSMGVIANSWNLSMYRFLKYYVFKPSLRYLGRFGAYLMTYFVSSMLHGLNFQLAAVLLSIGVYSYIENVLRRKLSRRLSACVLDRPCRGHCGHSRGKFNLLTLLVNLLFMGLAVFHLAYLGQMFVSDPDSQEFDYQGFSFWHTLRHWYRLDFLSHIVAGGTFLLSLLL